MVYGISGGIHLQTRISNYYKNNTMFISVGVGVLLKFKRYVSISMAILTAYEGGTPDRLGKQG